jgi:hypothetical protein
MKIEREKKELREKVEVIKGRIEQYNGKVKLCQNEKLRVEMEEKKKKVIDLMEKST